jgi:hypothetical protein
MARRLFGDRTASVVSLVEAPLSRSYAHKARMAFFASTAVTGIFAAAVLSFVMPLLWALSLALLTGMTVGLIVAAVVRAWPVLRVLWWWAFEIVTAGLLTAATVALGHVTAPLVALGIVVMLVGGIRLVLPVWRFVAAWGWCVIVRHRLRLCFAEFIRAANRMHPGRLPLILLARPTPAGERVWVWLRPGLALSDLEGGTGRMAVACWAAEVRVQRASTRYAALIRVDVTRRDPLVGLVVSPLAGRFRELEAVRTVPVLPSSLLSGLDLDGVPESPPPEDPRARRS